MQMVKNTKGIIMSEKVKIAIVGGYDIAAILEPPIEKKIIDTPYGKSPEIIIGTVGGKRVASLPRHGKGHAYPPHKVNYRANIWALKSLGVERIIANTAVGSVNEKMKPGDIVVLSNFIDFVTDGRPKTFYDGGESGVVHIDCTEPYCPEIRTAIIDAAKSLNLSYHPTGVYICTSGPRFETAAEIKLFKLFGADVVGMTQVPEVVLARELEMCYGAFSVITNFAAGISPEKLTHEEVVELMREKLEDIKRLYIETIKRIPEERNCPCKDLLKGAKG